MKKIKKSIDKIAAVLYNKLIKTKREKRKGKVNPNAQEDEKKNLSKGGTDHQTHKTGFVMVTNYN